MKNIADDIIASLPSEVLDNLTEEQKLYVIKQKTDPASLLLDITFERANLILLRIASLLSGLPVGDDADWEPELESLSMCEDKELIALLKKLIKCDAYKLRKKSTKETESKPKNDCPL